MQPTEMSPTWADRMVIGVSRQFDGKDCSDFGVSIKCVRALSPWIVEVCFSVLRFGPDIIHLIIDGRLPFLDEFVIYSNDYGVPAKDTNADDTAFRIAELAILEPFAFSELQRDNHGRLIRRMQ